MFPTRSLALILALTLSTSVPLTACAQEAPAPQAQPQAVQVADGCKRLPFGQGSYVELGEACDAQQRAAAQLIADRLDSGQRVEEDWTWQGMPPVVGAFNDALLDQWEAAGRPDASGWLESYAATVEA
jgi:hypothetical protein